MSEAMLPQGAQLRVVGANVSCVIDHAIGEGGQGTVYAAKVGSRAYALKWYRPGMADKDLRRRIPILIDRGSPDPRFLWPIEQVTDQAGNGFGYLMPLAPAGFRELFTLFAPSSASGGTNAAVNLRSRAKLGIGIVDCFLRLHAGGFCYRDINLGSFLIHPSSFAIRVCDNDNIDINGTSSPSVGTLLFMAPELVRGEAAPSADTDLHSLAVLLFYLLTDGHPLMGKAEYDVEYPDADDWQRLLGREPCFIFDPDDKRNAAVVGVHDRQIAIWNTLPRELRELFTRSFGAGLASPRRRGLPSEWRAALAIVRDTAVTCGCPTRFDTIANGTRTTADGDCRCSLCGAALPPVHRLEIGGTRIVLTADMTLLASQLGAAEGGDDFAIGAMAKSPTGLDGLRNVGKREWRITDTAGQTAAVPPGRGVTLAPGVRIDFGGAVATVLDRMTP
jgi:DNA-binding helix-hairpin-helix protein with protein kinase domain